MRIYKIFSTAVLFCLVTGLACAETSDATSAKIATVGPAVIYSQDLELPEAIVDAQKTRFEESEFEAWQQSYKQTLLQQRIWYLLTEQFLARQQVDSASEAEIVSLTKFLNDSEKNRPREFQMQRDKVLEQLNNPETTEERREELKKYIETLDSLIAQNADEQRREEIDPAYTAMKEQAERKASERMVYIWRFNKALYEHYGGRVIFQQAGWEPLDAYKAFFDEIQNEKYVTILDPAFTDAFDDYRKEFDKYFDLGHNFMEKKDADFYFDKPWWQRTEEELKAFDG